MKNLAPTEYPVHQLIRDRWSPRAFSEKEIAPADLRSLFEAARWAPSSSNEQPWAFIVATRHDHENFKKALQPLVEFNANWARHAVLGAVSRLAFAKTCAESQRALRHLAAMSQLSTGSHVARPSGPQMPDSIRHRARYFEIPAGWEAIAAFAIGYPGDPASLPQPYRERESAPRVRKPIREFVMSGKWGHTADFISK
jgi:hypothetical protein